MVNLLEFYTPEPSVEMGVCFYTDGGGKIIQDPIRKQMIYTGGTGIHGYLFLDNHESKTGAGIKGYGISDLGYFVNGDEEKPVSVFDLHNSVKDLTNLTVSTKITPVGYFNYKQGLENATNNVAETKALIESLKLLKAFREVYPLKKVAFVMDSKYVINSFINIDKYANNSWRRSDGKPLANIELWQEIHQLKEQVIDKDIRVTIEWTKGHQRNYGNIIADRLATEGLNAGLNAYYIPDLQFHLAKGYWSKRKTNSHPFYIESKWYFKPSTPIPQFNNLNLLYTGLHSEDERFCQPNSEDMFAVVAVKDIPASLLNIKEHGKSLCDIDSGFDVEGIHYVDLNVALHPDVMDTLEENKVQFLTTNRIAGRVGTADGKTILTRFSAPRLSVIGYGEYFVQLETLLMAYMREQLPKKAVLTDITNYFFEEIVGKKKNTIKVKIMNDSSIDIEHEPVIALDKEGQPLFTKIKDTLTFGITAPRRRVFNAIKDANPKIYLLTHLLENGIYQYYTIIQLNTGECGIWTNVFANTRVVHLTT